MDAQIIFPPEMLEALSKKIFELLIPHLQSPRDEILNVEETAKLVGKSKEQIYQWVNNSAHDLSDFPFWKAGKSLRFSKNELITWMKNNGKPLEKLTEISD